MFKKRIKAYFTIEASFLLPIITLLLWFLLIMGFYMYNLCAMYRISFSTSLKSAVMKRESENKIKEQAIEQISKMTEEGLLMMKEIAYDIKVTPREVQVILSGKMEIPIFIMLSEELDLWKIKTKSVRSRDNPVELIRDMRKIKDT